jgi:hypothetical protein
MHDQQRIHGDESEHLPLRSADKLAGADVAGDGQ